MTIFYFNKFVYNAYPRTKNLGTFFENLRIDSWKKNISLQINMFFYLFQKAIKQIKENNVSGSIVNFAGTYGIIGNNFTKYENTKTGKVPDYSAIKGGIFSFSRYLSSYVRKYDIQINYVSPGRIFNNHNPKFIENYEKTVPLKNGKPRKYETLCFIFIIK